MSSSFVIVYAVALIIDVLAPSFRAERNFSAALKLSVYSFTPVWLAGIFILIPGLRFLSILGLYGLYLLWTGLTPLMEVARDKSFFYALCVVCGGDRRHAWRSRSSRPRSPRCRVLTEAGPAIDREKRCAEFLTWELLAVVGIGFAAQVIDGALGMAFGVVSTSAMLALGMPPAQASAVVHTAEIFTTGASAASHIYHRNVDWRLVTRLGIAGVAGAALGAWVLSNVDASVVRPYVAVYLSAIGVFILFKALRQFPTRDAPAGWVPPVGFTAGFLDASGGGGWGPVATSTLVGSGHAPRIAVGSVNTTEFFVTVAAATTFFVELGAFSAAEPRSR